MIENSGFRLLDSEAEAEAKFKELYDKAVPYEVFKSPEPSVSAGFVIPDWVFPYTGDTPADYDQPGYRWNFQCGKINDHSYIHNILEDEDRTFKKTEFNIVFCPYLPDIQNIFKLLLSNCTKESPKARILIAGNYVFKAMIKNRGNLENELKTHGDLMRHMVDGTVDIAPIMIQTLFSQLTPKAPIDPIAVKYCPYCKAAKSTK